jgi:hypothetical protein
MRAAGAAHIGRRLQARAKGRPFGAPEDGAAVVVHKLHAAYTGELGGMYLEGWLYTYG